MRNLLVDLFELDYRVAAAAAPWEALVLCEAQRFDLALLDVCLPEMSGLDLLPLLLGLDPRMGVILMTVRGIVSDAVPLCGTLEHWTISRNRLPLGS